RTLSGVWRPTSLTTTGGGSGGSAGCCAATGCACGAGGGGAAGGGGGGVAATGVASPRGSHAASADKTTAPRSAWHPPRAKPNRARSTFIKSPPEGGADVAPHAATRRAAPYARRARCTTRLAGVLISSQPICNEEQT